MGRQIGNIKIDKIETGDIIFLAGITKLAAKIKAAQMHRGFFQWHMNHCGIAIWYDDILTVAEEDNPGKFDLNPFKQQYIDTNSVVYCGKIVPLSEKKRKQLQEECLLESAKNKLTNYAYLDILTFKINSLIWKIFKKNVWLGRKKNRRDRYTCSQRTAKFIQDYYNIMKEKSYLEFYPAEIADSELIDLYRICY